MTPDQAKDFFGEHQTRYLLAQFVDIHGAAKAKAVPVEHYDMVVGDGAGFAAFAVWGLGLGPHGPDFMGVGDPTTISDIPWMPGFARIACDGHVRGEPHHYCSRVALKRQLKRLADRGYTLYTGIEPEFMLLKRTEHGQLALYDATDGADKPCYDYKGLARVSLILDDLSRHLRSVGIDVYQIDHEDANGQFEINFTFADALKTADNMIFFHISIGTEGRKNAFYDKSDSRGLGLSEIGYWFLGGLLHHARALAAICAPTVNSYKRLVVGRSLSGATWAPAYIAYGDNNRTACVRIPYGRIELRLPDGAANPYLATAALAAAGLDGIDRRLDPGDPLNVNLYDLTAEQISARGIGLLPQSLSEALDALAADEVVQNGIGAELAAEFIRLKRMEWVEYSRHVGEWETQRYLEMF
jgi:glutamine synthetase